MKKYLAKAPRLAVLATVLLLSSVASAAAQPPAEHHEAAARQLDASFKIQNAQFLTDFPVRPRRKIEAEFLALFRHHHVPTSRDLCQS